MIAETILSYKSEWASSICSWWTFFSHESWCRKNWIKLGHLNIWIWKPFDATCGLLIARQEQLQVGDQVIARVTGTEARLPNFEVQKLQTFVIPSMSIAWGFDSGIVQKYTNEHTLLRKITIYIEYNTKLSLLQQASFPSPWSLPSFTCSATASSSSLATPRLRRANGLGSSLMKRQDNLNGGKCGSVVNLGFDVFQHLFWKQISYRHVNKAASYGFLFFEDSFQVISVAQKHNFDSFWPGRQKWWDSEWEVLLYQQAKVSNLFGLRVQKSIWNVPEKQVLLEFWPPKSLQHLNLSSGFWLRHGLFVRGANVSKVHACDLEATHVVQFDLDFLPISAHDLYFVLKPSL